MRETGLPVISVVGCSLGIADFNSTVRRFHVDRAKKYLELGYELEAKNYLIVIGEYIWQQEVIPPRDQWNWAVEGLRELGEYAAVAGSGDRHRAGAVPSFDRQRRAEHVALSE